MPNDAAKPSPEQRIQRTQEALKEGYSPPAGGYPAVPRPNPPAPVDPSSRVTKTAGDLAKGGYAGPMPRGGT